MAGNTARMLISELRTEFWWEKQKERAHMEDQGLDAVIVLN